MNEWNEMNERMNGEILAHQREQRMRKNEKKTKENAASLV